MEKKSKSFSVGQRVACYDIEATGPEKGTAHRTLGQVVGHHPKGAILFEPVWDKGAEWPVHPKQLRRLKKEQK